MTFRVMLWRMWYDSWLYRRLNSIRWLYRSCKFVAKPPQSAQHLEFLVRVQVCMSYKFAMQQADLAVVRKRNELYAQGVGPLDRRVPDIMSYLREWGQDVDADMADIKLRHQRQGYAFPD